PNADSETTSACQHQQGSQKADIAGDNGNLAAHALIGQTETMSICPSLPELQEAGHQPTSHADWARSSTTYERASLGHADNISDAQSRRPLSPSRGAIAGRFPELFMEASPRPSLVREPDFLSAFFVFAGQDRRYPATRYLLSYSASCAIT